MSSISKRCPKCGSVLGEGEMFCGGCGQPVNKTRAAGRGKKSGLRLAIAIGVVLGLLLIAADIGWNYMRDKPESLTDTQVAATVPSSKKDPVAPVNPSTAATPGTQSGVKLEDFVGTWVVAEEDGGEVVFTLNGNRIQGLAGPEKDRKMDLTLGDNGQLKGTITPPGESSIPMTVELSSDKKKIILTAAPPQSEYIVSVAWRRGEGPTQTGEDKTVDTAARVVGVTTGLGLDPQQRIKNPTSVFNSDTPEIFISTDISGVTGETAVDIKWVLSSGETIKGTTQHIKSDAQVGFSLPRPAKGWSQGENQAVVYLNGKESGKKDFSIK